MEILIDESIRNHWMYQDAEKFRWWIDLLLMADENGEIHMNLSDLYHRWQRPKSTILRFLEKLQVERIGGTIKLCGIESYKGVRNAYKEKSLSSPITPSLSKENIILGVNNAHAHEGFDREREQEFAERFRNEGLWYETAKVAGIDPHLVVSFFEAFAEESLLTEIVHKDYADYKRHFINYARIKKSKEQTSASGKQSNFDTLAQMAQELGL